MVKLFQGGLCALFLVGATLVAAAPAMAEGKVHHLAIHVDDGDPMKMNLALNNAENVDAYYKAKGESVVIELVAYGPGLAMFLEGKSPVAQRIAAMSLGMDSIQFSACGNTLKKMSEKAGKELPLLSEAVLVPSGVVRLIELQEEGYSYVRP